MSFAAPAVLFALVVLPAIWWLLQLTPPRPRNETFPPTALLLEIARKDETPARTPWWLVLLRLLLAALLIVALAGPVLNPSADVAPGSGPLLVVIDNGWAAGDDWGARADTAARIIALAADAERPVALVATADPAGQILAPSDPAEAMTRLEAIAPRPWMADAAALVPQLNTIAATAGFGGAVWVSDGLGGEGMEAMAAFLAAAVAGPVTVYGPADRSVAGLAPAANTADALSVPVIRQPDGGIADGLVVARDLRGRAIAEAPFAFAAGAVEAEAVFDLPAELRNEIVRLEIAGATNAGAVQLLDERYRRRTVGIVSGAPADLAQPLLAPDYYVTRAIAPFADLWTADEDNIDVTLGAMIESGLSVIVLADIGVLPPATDARLAQWVAAGGTLVRFAGPRLAAAEAAPTLLPVALRSGGRTLGGALSWEEPQQLGAFPREGPFGDLLVPADVLVERQVLAEPDTALPERVWATLADGTPLVTGAPRGDGLVVLFHVTADTSWSNLPLSGVFVEMLQRITALASAGLAEAAEGETAALPPYRVLDGFGRFAEPGAAVEPLATRQVAVGPAHPPGLYGAEGAFRAISLLAADTTLPPADLSALQGATVQPYPTEAPVLLRPWLLAAALVLMLLDALAMLWLAGAFRFGRGGAAAAGLAALGLAVAIGLPAPDARAQALSAADELALLATSETPLAYVLTGNATSDEISRAGLAGLSIILTQRTAFEPGPPIGVDLARDELAFFPLLYWRIDPAAPLPDSATIARIDAYMRNGGTILFDTADEIERTTAGLGGDTAAGARLRTMLASLDLPALEPVPADHVLTKAFYLLDAFPGRFAGGDLWVEALAPVDAIDPLRPARSGDGVTPIMITSNDFAAAWAIDERGVFLYPVSGGDQRQREFAFRTGVNLVIYTLTGNYKADQVHVPALLDRLAR